MYWTDPQIILEGSRQRAIPINENLSPPLLPEDVRALNIIIGYFFKLGCLASGYPQLFVVAFTA